MGKKEMKKRRLVKGVTFGLLSFATLLDLFGVNQNHKVYADDQDPTDGQNKNTTMDMTDETKTVETQNNLSVTTTPETPAPEDSDTSQTPAPTPENGTITPTDGEVTPDETPVEPEQPVQETEAPAPDTPKDNIIPQEKNVSQETPTPDIIPEVEKDSVETPEQNSIEQTEQNKTQEEVQPAALTEVAPVSDTTAEDADVSYQLVNANNGSSLHDLYINYLQSTGITDAGQLAELGAQVPDTMNIKEGDVLHSIAIGGTVYLPVLTDADNTQYWHDVTTMNLDLINISVTSDKIAAIKNGQVKYIAVNTIVPDGSNVKYIGDSTDYTSDSPVSSSSTKIVEGIEVDRNNSQSVAWARDPKTGAVDLSHTVTSNIQYGYEYDADGNVQKIAANDDGSVNMTWVGDHFLGGLSSLGPMVALYYGSDDFGYTGMNSFTDDTMILTNNIHRSTDSEAIMNGLGTSMDPLKQYPGILRDGVGNIIRFRLEAAKHETITIDTSQYTNQDVINTSITPTDTEVLGDISATKADNIKTGDQIGAVTAITPVQQNSKNTGDLKLTLSKDSVGADNSAVVTTNNFYYIADFDLQGKVDYKQAVKDASGNVTTTDLDSVTDTLGTAIQDKQPTDAPEDTHYTGTEVTPESDTIDWGTTTVTYNYAENANVTQNDTITTTDEDNHQVSVTVNTDNQAIFDSDFAGQDLTDTSKFQINNTDPNSKISGITATDKGFDVTFAEGTTDATHTISILNKETGTTYNLDLTLQGTTKYQVKLGDKAPVALADTTIQTENLGTDVELSSNLGEVDTEGISTKGYHYDTTTADSNTFTWGTNTVTYNYAADAVTTQRYTVATDKEASHTVFISSNNVAALAPFVGQDTDNLGADISYNADKKDNQISKVQVTDTGFEVTFTDDAAYSNSFVNFRNNVTGDTYQLNIFLTGKVVYKQKKSSADGVYQSTSVPISDPTSAIDGVHVVNNPEAMGPIAGYHLVGEATIDPERTIVGENFLPGWGTTTVTYDYIQNRTVNQNANVVTNTGDYTVSATADTPDNIKAFADFKDQDLTDTSKFTITITNNDADIKSIVAGTDGFFVEFNEGTDTASHTIQVLNNETQTSYTLNLNLQGQVQYQQKVGDNTPTNVGALVTNDLGTTLDTTLHQGDLVTGAHYIDTETSPKDATVVSWGTTTVTHNYAVNEDLTQDSDVLTTNEDGHTVAVQADADKQANFASDFAGQDLTDKTKFKVITDDQNITGVTASDNGFNVSFAEDTKKADHTLAIQNLATGLTYNLNLNLKGSVDYQQKVDNTTMDLAVAPATGNLGTTLGDLSAHQPVAPAGTHYLNTTTTPDSATNFTWGNTTVTYNYASDEAVNQEQTINTADTTQTTGHTVNVTADAALNMGSFTGDILGNTAQYEVTKDANVTGITATDKGFDVTFDTDTKTSVNVVNIRNKTTGETYNLTLTLQGQVQYQQKVGETTTDLAVAPTTGNLSTGLGDLSVNQPTVSGAYHYVDTTTNPENATTFTWGNTMVTYNYEADQALTQDSVINTADENQATGHTVHVVADQGIDMSAFSGQDLTDKTQFEVTNGKDVQQITATDTNFEITFAEDTTAPAQSITLRNKTTGETVTLNLTLQGNVVYQQNLDGTLTTLGTVTDDLQTAIVPDAQQPAAVIGDAHHTTTDIDPEGTTAIAWGTTTVTYNYAANDSATQTSKVLTSNTDGHVVAVQATDDNKTIFDANFAGEDLSDGTKYELINTDPDITGITASETGFNVAFGTDTVLKDHQFAVKNLSNGLIYNVNLTLQGRVEYKQNLDGAITELPDTTITEDLETGLGDLSDSQPTVDGAYHYVGTTVDPEKATTLTWGTTTVTYNYKADAAVDQSATINTADATQTTGHTVTVTAPELNMGAFTGDILANPGEYSVGKDTDITGITATADGFEVTFDNGTVAAGHNLTIRNKVTGDTYNLALTLQGEVQYQQEVNGTTTQLDNAIGNLGGTFATDPTNIVDGNPYKGTTTSPDKATTFTWGTTTVTYHYLAADTHNQAVNVNTSNAENTDGVVDITTDSATDFADFANQGDLTGNSKYTVQTDATGADVTNVASTADGFAVTFDQNTKIPVHNILITNTETGAKYNLEVTLQAEVGYYEELGGTETFIENSTELKNIGDPNVGVKATIAPTATAGTHYTSTEVFPGDNIVWGTNKVIYHYENDHVLTQGNVVDTADPSEATDHVITVAVDPDLTTDFTQNFANQDYLNNPDFTVDTDANVTGVSTDDTGFHIAFAPETTTPDHFITIRNNTTGETFILNLTLTGEVNYEVVWPDGTSHLVTDPTQSGLGDLVTEGTLGDNFPDQTIDDNFVKAHGDADVQAMLASGKYELVGTTPDPASMTFVWGNQTIQIEYKAAATTAPGGGGSVVDPDPTPNPDPEPTPEPTPNPDPDPEPTPNPDPDPEPTPNPDPEPTPDPEPEPDTDANVTNPDTGFEPDPQPAVPTPKPVATRPENGTAGLTAVAKRTITVTNTEEVLPQTGDDKTESAKLSALGTLGILGLLGGKLGLRKRKEDQ